MRVRGTIARLVAVSVVLCGGIVGVVGPCRPRRHTHWSAGTAG
jgi:hypothetical protein